MCIAFIKRDSDSLVIALNRDEFYARSATPVELHKDEGLYYGKDLKAGGTWFVADTEGNFALVTNIRRMDLIREDVKSRGEIPFKLIRGESINHADYNPFNALWGNKEKIFYTNSINTVSIEIQENIIGLSNSTYPCQWPKVVNGIEAIKQANSVDEYFKVMLDKTSYDYIAEGTGLSFEQEKALTPIFLELPDYGTVSTVLMVVEVEKIVIKEKRRL